MRAAAALHENTASADTPRQHGNDFSSQGPSTTRQWQTHALCSWATLTVNVTVSEESSGLLLQGCPQKPPSACHARHHAVSKVPAHCCVSFCLLFMFVCLKKPKSCAIVGELRVVASLATLPVACSRILAQPVHPRPRQEAWVNIIWPVIAWQPSEKNLCTRVWFPRTCENLLPGGYLLQTSPGACQTPQPSNLSRKVQSPPARRLANDTSFRLSEHVLADRLDVFLLEVLGCFFLAIPPYSSARKTFHMRLHVCTVGKCLTALTTFRSLSAKRQWFCLSNLRSDAASCVGSCWPALIAGRPFDRRSQCSARSPRAVAERGAAV